MTRRDHLLLAALSLVVLLPGTFGVSLVDRDEGWYAQVSREMLDTGDWLIPHYLGEPWIAKPPLLYWCAAAAFAVFGVHAWAARLVSVLAVVVVVQLLATLAAEFYNRRVAVIAAGSFVTAGLPAIVGKLVLTDSLLLLFCLAAMAVLWPIATRGASLARSACFWLFVGLAVLAKGPAVIVFVGAFALGVLVSLPRRWLRDPRFWVTFPVCLAIAAPWYVFVARHAGGVLWQQFIGYEILARLAGTPHGHGGPPGYYVLLSLAGWLPWTPLVPGAVFESWRARREDRVAWLLLLWWGLPWALLELIPSKLPHYILPCYVSLAIMFGRMWDLGLSRTVTGRQRIVRARWVVVMIALGAALIAAATAWRQLAWSPAVGVAGATLVAGFAIVGWLVRGHRLWSAWRGTIGATAVFQVLIGVWALPGFEPYRLSRRIAEQANALCTPGTEVLACGYTEPTMFFYLQRPARLVGSDEVRRALADGHAPRVLILRDPELAAAGIVRQTDGDWQRVAGFNYVKGRQEVVWVVRVAADSPGDRSF
jgi:4-amino-4-deoxy-L-arabinose transferase-like glycosyltransferase